MSLMLLPQKCGNRPASSEGVVMLLQRLSARYGTQFADKFGGVPRDVLIAEWAEGLGGFTVAEIERGMQALRAHRFPPNLPEFVLMCRPGIDPSDAFIEAAKGMALRDSGQEAQWQHPAVYWAAVEFGSTEIRMVGYSPGVRARWERLLSEQLAKGEWRPIPRVDRALPAPPNRSKPRPELAERLRQQVEQMRMNSQPKVTP